MAPPHPDAHRRRFRAAVRQQLPRAVRADRTCCCRSCSAARPAGGDDEQRHRQLGPDPFRRPAVRPRRYRGGLAYAQSKLANLLVAPQLAEVARSNAGGICCPRWPTRATPGPTCRPPARTSAATSRAGSCSATTPSFPRRGSRRAPSHCCSPPPAPMPSRAATTGPAGGWDWSDRPGRRGSRGAHGAPTWRHRCGRSPRI